MITLNTKASGQFSVYIPDDNGNLQLVTKSQNLVVDTGLDAVGFIPWASCLTTVLAGSGTSTPTSTDLLSSITFHSAPLSATGSPAAPACYTLVDLVTAPVNASSDFRIGKTFQLTNTLATSALVTEVGISCTTTPNLTSLFSRSKLVDPFVLNSSKFAYIIYELTLKTDLTRQGFAVTTDGTGGFDLPNDAELGLFNCPYAYLESNGAVQNSTFASGQAPFEPSNPTYYLYYLRTNPAAGYFDKKRDWFEQNQTNLLANLNTEATAATYTACHTNGHTFSNDDGGTYIRGTRKRMRHIIVSPEVPSVVENIYGFAITTVSAVTDVRKTGLQCIFPTTAWSRPTNVFTKLYFEQTWSA
jgi:hypothetical protein